MQDIAVAMQDIAQSKRCSFVITRDSYLLKKEEIAPFIKKLQKAPQKDSKKLPRVPIFLSFCLSFTVLNLSQSQEQKSQISSFCDVLSL